MDVISLKQDEELAPVREGSCRLVTIVEVKISVATGMEITGNAVKPAEKPTPLLSSWLVAGEIS